MKEIKGHGFQIRQLSTADVVLFEKLIRLFYEVFEMKKRNVPAKAYLKKLLERTDFVVCVTLINNEVAGGLTAYQLPMYYRNSSEFFIYDIAVKPAFQRKGLGSKLISALKEFSLKKGVREIFVAADKEDRHARDFYQAIGGKASKVIHFSYKLSK